MQQCSWLSKLRQQHAGQETVPSSGEAHRLYAGKKETNSIRSTEPNHANSPRATEMGTATHPAPWVTEGQKLYPRKGPPDPRKRPPNTLPRSLGLNSIALLIHCSATGHRLQGRKKTQAIKQIHAYLKQKLQSDL